MPVDPRGADLERYLREDPGGPVVMLDPLRHAEAAGSSARGAALVAEAGQEWDAVPLARYPAGPRPARWWPTRTTSRGRSCAPGR